MKKSLSVIVSLFLFVLVGTTVKTDAVEHKSESIGETSFYGSYEYEKEDEHSSVATRPNHSNYSGSQSVAGLVVLPRTGENLQPVYAQIGFILLGGLAILIIKEKRKKGYE